MFRGVSFVNLDDKGRMAVPARYRAELQDCCNSQLVVTLAADGNCLTLYPLPEFEEVERRLARLPSLHERTKRLQRLISGYATEVELDGQGRFLIPEALRKVVRLGKKVVLVGQLQKFEIWDEDSWNTKCEIWIHEERAVASADLPPELTDLVL